MLMHGFHSNQCDKPNQSIVYCKMSNHFNISIVFMHTNHAYFVNSSFELNGNGDRDGFPDPKCCNYGIITKILYDAT